MRFQAERLAAVRDFNSLKLSKSKNIRNDMNEGMPIPFKQTRQTKFYTRQVKQAD